MLARENAIQSLNKKTIGLRLGSIVGISNNMRIDSLYTGLYKQAFVDTEICVWSENAERSILWYKDILNCFEILVKNSDHIISKDIYNISSFNTTVGTVAKTISDFFKKPIKLQSGFRNERGFKIDCSKFCDRFSYTMIGTSSIIHSHFLQNRLTFIELINKQVCLICNSALHLVLNLGEQPLANDLRNTPQNTCKYPLELYRCISCNHTQIGFFVDKSTLFKNYLYESGVSRTSKQHFSDFAEIYSTKVKNSSRKVLEIASNDGSQLDEFKIRGWETYGVDPAENIVSKSINRSHNIICDFWGNSNSTIFKDVIFDLIIAQNVLAHVTNPVEFIRECVLHMDSETMLVIQTSQSNMYFNGEFDTIYHEHISFFSIKSMQHLAKRCGIFLINAYKADIHGTSYIFELKKNCTSEIDIDLLKTEESLGLYDNNLYSKFSRSTLLTKSIALSIFKTYKDSGYSIIGYGAAAKGNVFLNYISNSTPLDLLPEVIIDESVLKIDMYCPCINIPIKDISILKKYTLKKVCIIILAWNFSKEIHGKIKSYIKNNNIDIDFDMIMFFPNLSIFKNNA
jgi:hypothetical protein